MGLVTVRRTTTVPNSHLRVFLDDQGEFAAGGSFYFAPAGQDGDSHQMGRRTAEVLMADPGLAAHFVCQPPVGPQAADSGDGVPPGSDTEDGPASE